MNNWSYSDLLKLVEIKDKNIDHYLERITELETELERTRKALEIAKDGLQRIADAPIGYCMFAEETLDKITALKQKDK